jgi:1-acyl-sn-glycerol-3-phosphate acyltransferase
MLSNTYDPTRKELWKLRIQAFAGWCIYFPQGLITGFIFKYILGYKIKDHKHWRKTYKDLVKPDLPLMICSNHLTFIDSIIIIWAFGSTPWYFSRYQKLTWNLPAAQYSRDSMFFKIFCYVSKCLFIERGRSAKKIKSTLNVAAYLLKTNRILTVFPEGTRSRTGSFDRANLKNGAGRLLSTLENPRVACLYLRGDKQKAHSKFPPKNSTFTLSLKVIYPKSNLKDNSHGDIVSQIGDTIDTLEKNYFLNL